MNAMNFQVNLSGMIELLSNHLYSDNSVFIRELLQNAVDAITARKKRGQAFEPQVTVELHPSRTAAFHDNGCGLTEQEIRDFLSRIGSTSKREELDAGDDFIGQFGVGLLSCFIVCNEIVLVTRSSNEGAPALEWRGCPDGTYTIRELAASVPVGTSIYIRAKEGYEQYFEHDQMEDMLRRYGSFLDTPIVLEGPWGPIRINDTLPPWRMSRQDALEYGEREYYNKPLDVIPLRSAIGEAEGVAYLLPYAVSLQEEKQHRIYMKQMMVSERNNRILPSWAFFVNAIVNVNGVRPTASRESFQENDLFFAVQHELGECIKRHLIGLSERDPELFATIIRIHYASIKTLAIEDEEIYHLFMPYLSFETVSGRMEMHEIIQTLENYAQEGTSDMRLYVTATLDEFRQIARVAKAQNMMVVNGGYVHDFELIRKLNGIWDDVEVDVLDVLDFSSRFKPLKPVDSLQAAPLLATANRVLKPFQCESSIRWFQPADVPVLYNTNAEINFLKMAEKTSNEGDELFAGVVKAISDELNEVPYARLCFNYNNPLVRKAIEAEDDELRRTCIELFYTQALLMGNYPMSQEELRLMNQSLLAFMERGLGSTADGVGL
ncbi:HSP90 family protein [Paenibacillus xylaniclasticus]|uniref:HSP90 family protein n=1 Tax=Paenibacillus xylaniclasticus TaxID=588083 RepID=UPI0017713869|nr:MULTISPECIES: HSP90 family protein [Paenibacillus]GFN31496.1 molecular chaperone HtpG [Paenibacillus curdlanolyticus]